MSTSGFWLRKESIVHAIDVGLVVALFPIFKTLRNWRRYTFLGVAAAVGAWTEELPRSGLDDFTLAEAERLGKMYDGSIDTYLDGYSLYVLRKWLDGGDAERNDPFDLDNLVYLRPNDASQIFVTGDSQLLNLLNLVAPGRGLHVDDLRHCVLR